MTKVVRDETTKVVGMGHLQRKHQNNNITIIIKGANITSKRSTSKQGSTFTVVKKDAREEEEEKGLSLYLQRNIFMKMEWFYSTFGGC